MCYNSQIKDSAKGDQFSEIKPGAICLNKIPGNASPDKDT